MVCTCWVDTVFIWDDFPEFSTDLITALTCLDVNEFSHFNDNCYIFKIG
jgi:hypothetical protein